MTTQCDECGESTTVRFIDDEKRCGYFCEACVPRARHDHKCSSQFDGKPCVVDYAPHRRGMCALAGVDELRAVVRWADSQRESSHEGMTAEQIIARFRLERDS